MLISINWQDKITQRQLLFILLFSWLIVQAVLLLNFGIVTTKEADKYFVQCNNLLTQGYFGDKRYIFYAVYIFIHALFATLGFETLGVYLFQLVLNLFALCLFLKVSLVITERFTVAFIATLLLILTPPFEIWTTFLYTESVFGSLIISFFYCIFAFKKYSIRHLILFVFIFSLLMFARPTGLLFIPIITLYLLYILLKNRKYISALIFSTIMILTFIKVLDFAMHSSQKFDFMKPFLENEILCYIPTGNSVALTAHAGTNNIIEIGYYIIDHPKQFLYLSYEKFISYWGMQRYYNSKIHNVYLACFFYPIYLFAFIGLIRLQKQHHNAFMFIILLLSVFTGSVLLTCDDWSNRFNVPIIPFIMVLGAIGIDYCINRLLELVNNTF